MSPQQLPETTVDRSLAQAISALSRTFTSVEAAEIEGLGADIAAPLRPEPRWIEFCESVSAAIRQRGYIVVRGLEADEGRSLLIVSAAFESEDPFHVVAFRCEHDDRNA